MKNALTVAALFLLSLSAHAADHTVVAVTCGANHEVGDLAKSDFGVLFHNGMYEFYLAGSLNQLFTVTAAPAGQQGALATDEASRPKGNDVSHTEYAFNGNCIDQSVTATKSQVGGVAGTLKSPTLPCTCTYTQF